MAFVATGTWGGIANDAGMVVVEFGDEPLLEESDSPPSDDVGGEATPRSDGSDRFCFR